MLFSQCSGRHLCRDAMCCMQAFATLSEHYLIIRLEKRNGQKLDVTREIDITGETEDPPEKEEKVCAVEPTISS